MNRIPLYVINEFLKFDRKIYQVFGLRLGRPIRLKLVLYFIILGTAELVWYFIPVLGTPLHLIPVGLLVFFPGLLTYLLSGVGTEDRSPVTFFRSFFAYQARRLKRVTYHKGRELEGLKTVAFRGHITYQETSGTRGVKFEPKRHRFHGYVTYKNM